VDSGPTEARLSRHDDVLATIERLADRIIGLAAHDDRLAQGDLAEALEVGGEPPGQFAIAADEAIFGHGYDKRDSGFVHECRAG
jgi:hypothetical protein